MGVERAPVKGSGAAPAWIERVSNLNRERIFIELITSDRKLRASKEDSKGTRTAIKPKNQI